MPDENGDRAGTAVDQADVIAFLSRPESHASGAETVEVRETHGALVFLAGPVALKIKRQVAFSYMDFSTLEKRRRAIVREFEINCPNAPEIYRDVVAITREPDGALAIGGSGVAVEWALRMRRFDEGDLLSVRAAAGPFAPALAKALADAVHDAHLRAPAATGADSGEQMQAILDDVAAAVASHLPPVEVAAFHTRGRAQLARVITLLAARARDGFVRRCHGDLHLGNIVLEAGRPVLFDAIEFDEALATIDTLYDLAFLLMDLCHRGDRRAANIVMNRYLWRTRALSDLEGLGALPLFLGLRAGVRAMVTAQRAAQEQGQPAEADRRAARDYLEASLAFLDPPEPRLVAVGGLSGTGKSTLAAALAPRFGAAPGGLHLRSDLERKALFGAAETERLPPAAYTREVTRQVYAELLTRARAALAAGHAVVTDAVYAEPGERAAVEGLAAELRLPFTGLWLEAPKDVLMARVGARRGDASDATPQVVEGQLGYDIGPLAWTRVSATGRAEDTLRGACAVLGLDSETS